MNTDDIKMLAETVGVPVQKLSAETIAKVDDAPQSQTRTSNYKKAVKIVEDLVFKGAYTSDKDLFRLMRNLRYSYAIELLESALQLPEWQRGSLRWQYVGCCNDNQYYLVGPNVGKWKNIPFERVTTKIEKNVPVIPRGGAVWRVSDVEKNGRLTNNIKLAALQHLYFRFLLDIGDSGTHNVLMRDDYDKSGRLIAGIDLEEEITDKVKMRRLKIKNQRLDLLFSRVSYKKHYTLYQSDVRNIKSLTYSQLDQQTLDSLSVVGVNLKRLKQNINLW
jgi:hypothetical protein